MKKLIFLILILAFSGCVSRKSAVKEVVKFDETVKVDSTLQVKQTKNQKEEMVKVVVSNIADKSITESIKTDFSVPDESGNQFKISEEKTTTRNDINTNNEAYEEIISDQKKLIDRQGEYITELNTNLVTALESKTKTATRTPLWVYAAIYIAGLITIPAFKLWIGKYNR